MRRAPRGWALTLAIALCLAAVPVAIAAFTATTTNSGNSFQAAATFPGTMKTPTGSYVGDGADNRTITLGFQPDYVVLKAGSGSRAGVARTSSMSGDAAKPLSGAAGLAANLIQSFTPTAFTIGTDTRVNANGVTYHWTAFRAGTDALAVGSYGGDGGASRAVTGAGFQPEYVAVLGASAQRATHRFDGMTRGFQFDADTGTTTRVTSLDSDGFTVGNSAEVNASSTTYHYVAFNHAPGSIDIGSYSGSGADNRNFTGPGFRPGYVLIRSGDTGTARAGVHRTAPISGDSTLLFSATANGTNRIQALQAQGFQLGTDAAVNSNGIVYHYLAVQNTGGGCSQPGPQTLTATGDAWFEQSSPNSNSGSDSVLKVTSKSGNSNTRAVVGFALPTLPSGCTLTGATLRLYNKSPISGRTLEALGNTAAWTEGGVNWNNQPATAPGAATAATPSSAAWMQWNVLSQVEAMYSAGTSHGFKVKDQTEGNNNGYEQQFDSDDAGGNTAQLVLSLD